MPQVVIENPVINAPFSEPTRHFRFTDEGISNEIVDARRVSTLSPSPGLAKRAASSFSSIPSGRKTVSRKTKVATARTLWVPAVNNHGGFGRWAFTEIADPWDAENLIRTSLQKRIGAEPLC